MSKATQALSVPSVVSQPAAVSEAAAIFSMIERVASQPDVPIERVEKLFELYQKMESERARRAYYAALAVMLPKIPVIARKGRITGNIKDDNGKKIGTQTQSQYAKWEDIVEVVNPIVTAHGFAIEFGSYLLALRLPRYVPSGATMMGELPLVR